MTTVWKRGRDDRCWCVVCKLPMTRRSDSDTCELCSRSSLEPNPHPSTPCSQLTYDGRGITTDLQDIASNILDNLE